MHKQSHPLILGIDLGGTKILTALIDSRGKMLARDHSITPATLGPAAVIKAIWESAGRCFAQTSLDDAAVDAIGIGAPGPSNPERGILFTSPNLPNWHDVPVVDIFEEEFKKKAFLINDANAAALAEFKFGAARGLRHVIYITVSTGIGGGIIIDGQLYTGAIGTAAELGHMTINDQGPRCNCGNIGCWETLASGTALAREARQKIRDGAQTTILEQAAGDIVRVDAKAIQLAAEQGDGLAKELITQTGYYFGVGLANLLNMFNPQMIIIGGGVSNMGEMLLTPAYQTARERAYDVAYDAVQFASPKLGRNSGVLGAAAFVLDQLQHPTFFSNP
ncbi:MAG: ROK family protein [Desulfohalobiaceae bacterium]|nr:ROK family protein [Desulfohalobiaceae bacterium]